MEITEELSEAVKYVVRYQTKNEEGETRAERNARFNMAHHTPEEPEIPEHLAHIWDWFWQLSSRRRSGFAGPEAIGYADITAWINLTGASPNPEEVEVIVALDSAFLAAVADEQVGKKQQTTHKL